MRYVLKRNDYMLICGTVEKEVTGSDGKAVIEIAVDSQNNEKEIVKVFVNDYNGQNGNNKAGTNLLKFNPRKGSFLTFYGKEKEGENSFQASGFRANGRWKFAKKDELPERNVLVGVIRASNKQSNKAHYSVSVPVAGADNTTTWHHVTFVNHEDNALADNIRKCIKPGETAVGYIVCGEEKEWNGTPDYFGNYFQIVKFPKRTENTQEAEENLEDEVADGGIQTEVEESKEETISEASINTSTNSSEDDSIVITFGKLQGKTIGELKGTDEGKSFYNWIVKSNISFTDERGKQIEAVKRAFA